MSTPRTLIVCSMLAGALVPTRWSNALGADRELRLPLPRISPLLTPKQSRCQGANPISFLAGGKQHVAVAAVSTPNRNVLFSAK